MIGDIDHRYTRMVNPFLTDFETLKARHYACIKKMTAFYSRTDSRLPEGVPCCVNDILSSIKHRLKDKMFSITFPIITSDKLCLLLFAKKELYAASRFINDYQNDAFVTSESIQSIPRLVAEDIHHIGEAVHTASAGPAFNIRQMYETAVSPNARSCTITLFSVALYRPRICACCGHKNQNRLSRCSGCHVTWYCSRACRDNDWSTHKKLCEKRNEECNIRCTGIRWVS